jgi:CBS domain-containing protein
MAMKAKDIMTRGVISVAPETSVIRAAELMLQYDISGFPVIERSGKLVGIVTESDFLRRAEIGTERYRQRWRAPPADAGRLAEEYVRTHAGTVEQVMSREMVTVAEDAPLGDVVNLMESRHIRRVPVMRNGAVVGIVSHRDLLHAFVSLAKKPAPPSGGDMAIRRQILAEIEQQEWAPRAVIAASVIAGVVELRGVIIDERQRAALRVLVGNVPGVKSVRDLLVQADSSSGPDF